MNSRERLLAALERKPVDRVPISTYELVGYNSVSFENQDPSYARLMDSIRQRTDCVAMWNPGCNATFGISSAPVQIDVDEQRTGNETIGRYTAHTPRGPLTFTTRVQDHIHTVWRVEHWCKSPEDVDRALSVPFEPLTFDMSDYARIQAEVGERGIIMATLEDPLCLAAELMEFGQYCLWAMTQTDHFVATLETLHAWNMENLRRMLAAGVVDLYRICGPEYATPPYLPPTLFERFVVPYVREMTQVIHEHGGRVRLHSHGKIGRVLEMIAACGVDALDPIEAPPDGDVELTEVKRVLGGRMCLFGNIQLKLLEHGTPEQVRAAVRGCMQAAKAGGGFVLMPTAAPINTPLSPKTERNYQEYIDAALEDGVY